MIALRNSPCKRDALPTELTARSREMPGNTWFFGQRNPPLAEQTGAVGERADLRVPNYSRTGFPRRSSSRSTASRMNLARPYVPTSASMRSSVSCAIRTGVGFMCIGGRPMRGPVAGAVASCKKTIPFSVDAINDAVYINGIVLGDKPMTVILETARASIYLMDGEYYVYGGQKLIRVCPSIGMAREVAAGL